MDGAVIQFSCEGKPRGKGRPRLSTRGGFARAFTDPLTRAYEASISEIARVAMGTRAPFTGPISFSLRVRLSVPVSMSKKQRARVLLGEEPYFGRGDADNFFKSVADACNGIVFADDKQIVRLFVTKEPHINPGLDVKIMALGD